MTQTRIVGRHPELAALQKLINDLDSGAGAVVFVDGEPGIGKSSLVDAALAGSWPADWPVFRAAADEFTQMFDLGVLVEALEIGPGRDVARAGIADLLAGRVAGTTDVVMAASERLVALVDDECARSPIALVLDDLHWADDASLRLWHRLAGLVSQLPLLLIGMSRRIPRRAEVDQARDAVATARRGVVLSLAPLTDDAAMLIARSLVGAARIGPGLSAVLAQAGGNPLFVHEMVDVLRREGVVKLGDGVADVDGDAVSPAESLPQVIGRRLDFLSADGRAALRLAALLDVRFTLDDLARATGLSLDRIAAFAAEGLATGVLAQSGDQLWFRYPVIRLALQEEVPLAVRVGVHQHIAKGLIAADAPWQPVARHLLAGSETIDGWALDWLVSSDPAMCYSHPVPAATLLDRAFRSTPSSDPRREVLIARLTTALRLLNRQDELIEIAENAAGSLTDPDLAGETAWNLIKGLGLAGRFGDAVAVLGRIADGPTLAAPWRSRLAAMQAPFLAFGGMVDAALECATRAIEEGQRDGDPVTAGWGYHWRYFFTPGGHERLAVLDRALAVVTGNDPESLDLRLLLEGNRLGALSSLFATAEFDAALPPALALAENAGSARLSWIRLVGAEHYFRQGRWDECLLYMEGPQSEDTQYRIGVHGTSMLVAVRRDDWETVAHHQKALAGIPYRELPLRAFASNLLLAEALQASADGRPHEALAILSSFVDDHMPDAANVLFPELMRDLLRLALAAGDRDTALAALAAAQPRAASAARDLIRVNADVCQAMYDDAPDALLELATELETAGQRPALAFTLEEAAARMSVRGDEALAGKVFQSSLSIYEDLGARFDVRRSLARMRALGIRPGPRVRHARATTGWAALSPAERDVANRIGRGLSNSEVAAQLFLSRRTVETHVAHIAAKLGVESRSAIAAIAHRDKR